MAVIWRIDCVDVWSRDGKTNVVDQVHYTVFFDGGEAPAQRSGVLQIPYDPNAAFKPIEELTEADMVGWTQDQINAMAAAANPSATATGVEQIEFQLTREATLRTITPKAVQDRLATETAAVALTP